MRVHGSLCAISLIVLSACGGSTSGTPAVDTVASLPAIGMGTAAGTEAENGLPFAATDDGVESIEGQTVQVRMARMHRHRETGALSYLVSDETVTVDAGFYDSSRVGSRFTIGGVTYEMASDAEDTADGYGLRHDDFEYSGFEQGAQHRVTVIRTGAADVIWDRGFFILGRETDFAALPSGNVSYEGHFRSTATMAVNGGTPAHDYRAVNGTMTFDVDFDTSRLGGSFSAIAVTKANDEAPTYSDNIFGTIPAVALAGNGFESTMVIDSCPSHDACASDSIVGGAFYGADAGRLSGILLIDMTFTRSSDGAQLRLQGPGVFATEVTE